MIDTNSNKGKININFITPTFGGSGKGAVSSVNGRTGDVVLTAEDVKALPEDTYIPSLEGYATEEYVIETVQDLELENYYTKEEIDVAIENVEVDLTGYATEEYVQNAVEGLEGPMGPQGPQGEPGTSGIHIGPDEPTDEDMYVWIDLEGTPEGNLATVGYVDQAIADAAPDLTPYALKEEIPSTTGLATEDYVKEQIEAIPDVDLTGYATETYVDEAIGGIPGTDLSNYYNKDEIDAALENVEVDLTGYATEQYVDDAIDAIDIPDNTPIATVDVVGKVKPDGTTITIAEDGTITSVATGGGGSVEVDGTSIVNNDGVISLAYPIASQVAIGTGSQHAGTGGLAAGFYSKAYGLGSVALATNAEARKSHSVAIGQQAVASSEGQIVLGRRNITDSNGKYILIVGNGEEPNANNGYTTNFANAFTIDTENKVWAPSFYAGGTSIDDAAELATKQYVDDVAAGSIDMSTYATRTYVDDAITEALAAIVDGDEVSY